MSQPETSQPEPETERPVPLEPRFAARARWIATAGLAALAALLAIQILGRPLPALGACVGAALVAGLAWGPLVLRPTGIALGGAALTGVFALAGGYVGAGLVGAGGSPVVTDHESAIALLFSFWIVLPVMVAAAIGIAVATGLVARRRAEGHAAD